MSASQGAAPDGANGPQFEKLLSSSTAIALAELDRLNTGPIYTHFIHSGRKVRTCKVFCIVGQTNILDRDVWMRDDSIVTVFSTTVEHPSENQSTISCYITHGVSTLH